MSTRPMLTEAEPENPRAILYRQVGRVLEARANGSDGSEEMAGLMSLLAPVKDPAWYEDLRRPALPTEDDDTTFWGTFEAALRLLARRHLWPRGPGEIEEGREFAEAV